MGSVAEEEVMSQTPNPPSQGYGAAGAQRPTIAVEVSAESTTSNIKHRTSNIIWRIVGFIVAGIFIFAGLSKILDLDHFIADLGHLHFGGVFADLRQLSLASPTEFANDIDNFKILPWPVCVALAFYLPWLEIFCGFALVVRLCYRGALSILTMLILVFTLAMIAAKVRGLDITCGCFGHASQNWSFPSHLATNLAILAGLLALWFQSSSKSL
jgi:uncharacterized membrane protein YphA (DoxX/SURF4 family)